MKTNLFKKTVTATLTALVATSLFATTAKADCVNEYNETANKLARKKDLVSANTAGAGVLGVMGIAGAVSYAPEASATLPQAAVPAAEATLLAAPVVAGAVGGAASTDISSDIDDIYSVLALMRDVQIGHGLALNAFYREINTRGFYPEDKVLAFLKEIFAGQALCRDEQLATRTQLLEWAAGAIR